MQPPPAGVEGYFASLALPTPLVLAWLVIILKIVAGGALVVGCNVGCAARVLIVFTLLTVLIAHPSIADPHLFKNLAIVGGLLYVAAFGAGRFSSDKN